MGIRRENNLFYIDTRTSSMILEQREGHLFLKHLGKKIGSYHFSNSLYERDHAFSGNPTPDNRSFSFDTQRQVMGQHGLGDFRQPSIRIEHGNNEVTDFRLKTSRVLKGASLAKGLPNPHSTEAAETLELCFEDDVTHLSLQLYLTAYEENGTFSSFYQLKNKGDKPVVIHRLLSFMADLPAATYDLVSFQGAYGREKTVRHTRVEQGIFQIRSNRGASGHAQTPSMILCAPETSETAGEALAVQLMYSGNFQAFVQKNQVNEVRLGIGINDENFAWELHPAEEFTSPVALVTYSDQGLNGLSQESRAFVQNHIIPKEFAYKERPILINNWEATYFDFTKEKLITLADEAVEMGMELFVLDDGWFGNRYDDNRALGDWVVNEEKLGGSLSDLIEEIHHRSLQFGLWVEPEMISIDSDLYRAHPDWAIQVAERGHTYSRNQLVLNYANQEVVSYIKQMMDDLLGNHSIDYIKWDMNRNITNLGNGETYLETQMQSHRYMLGLYEIVSYLTEKYPHILFESCAGGGGRNDLGMMRYFPQVWASDNTDAIARLSIQYGSSYLYPSISMGSHVSAVPNHQMGRITPLRTRAHVAMMGNLGYELDLTTLSHKEKKAIKEQVQHYKTIRPLVQFGKQYRLINPEEGSNEAAVQFIDKDQVLVTYVRIQSTLEMMETTLKLKGLEEEASYECQETGAVYSGAELMYAGLTMVLPQGDYLSQQLHFIKKD